LETTNDFWPGEFQKTYVWVGKDNPKPNHIIKGLKSGNSFTVMGDLIDDLEFTISKKDGKAKTMGETLKVGKKGDYLQITVRFHDPEGANHAPYKFPNPSLWQIGIEQPLNMPEVDNVQLICGDVTGKIKPKKEAYTYPHNDNMWDVVVVSRDEMFDEGDGWYSFEHYVTAENDFYCRLRGTNLPPGTPHETHPLDTDAPEGPGGPMLDTDNGGGEGADNIPCDFEDCPEHIGGYLTNDVEAWADVWFYANPIFVDVK
jgi:hypothetical protein